jgi:hypothetical protein
MAQARLVTARGRTPRRLSYGQQTKSGQATQGVHHDPELETRALTARDAAPSDLRRDDRGTVLVPTATMIVDLCALQVSRSSPRSVRTIALRRDQLPAFGLRTCQRWSASGLLACALGVI